MGQVTRIAKGYSGLIGLKGEGQTPGASAEFVQPIIDMTWLYAAEKGARVRSAAGGVGALLATVDILVPSGEVWLVHNAAVRMQFGAAGQEFFISLRRQGVPGLEGSGASATELTSGRIGPSLGGAGSFQTIQFLPAVPLIMLGGESVSAIVYDAAAFSLNTLRVQVIATNISIGPGQVGQFL